MSTPPPSLPGESKTRRSGWERWTHRLLPLLTVALFSTAGGMGGATAYEELDHLHTQTLVRQLSELQQSGHFESATLSSHGEIVSVSDKHQDHGCIPTIREQLEKLRILDHLQELSSELQESQAKSSGLDSKKSREDLRTQLDLDRGELQVLLRLLATCPE